MTEVYFFLLTVSLLSLRAAVPPAGPVVFITGFYHVIVIQRDMQFLMAVAPTASDLDAVIMHFACFCLLRFVRQCFYR